MHADMTDRRAGRRRAGAKRMLIPVGILLVAFACAMLLTQGPTTIVNGVETFQSSSLPSGLESIVSLFVQLTLPPTALFVFAIAGILAPPMPFLTGALLGVLDGLLWTALFLLSPGAEPDAPGRLVRPSDVVAIILVAAIVGLIVTGIIGTIANKVLDGRDRSREIPAGPAMWPGRTGAPPCPHCGAATLSGASFCRECGVQLGPTSPPSDA